jgi:hypothetical protein
VLADYDWNWKDAQGELARALAPGDGDVHRANASPRCSSAVPRSRSRWRAAQSRYDPLCQAWLGRAYAVRDPGLGESVSYPLLRALHGDPRWHALMRRVGFG